jgi:N-acetylglucosamine-6-sulfatase
MVQAYMETILSVDDSVGRLTEYLRSSEELDDTVFVFMGDNGLLEGEHGMVDKRTAHEPSIRVPMIIRYPELTPDGPERIEGQVLTVDVAPTLLDLCEAEPLNEIHGRSVKPLVMGETDQWRDAWFYHYNYEKQFPYTPNVRAIRTDRWKYIRYPHGDGGPDRHMAELYDLENDPGETNNLINEPEYADLIRRLRGRLVELMKETGIEKDEMPLDEGIGTELPDEAIR